MLAGMSQWLTLSRAAHLLGISRVALQKRIREGELPSFDGMVDAADLLRAWPQLDLEDSGSFEKTRAIREDSFARRLRERVLPSQEALAQRLFTQGQELAELQRALTRYHALFEALRARLDVAPAPTRMTWGGCSTRAWRGRFPSRPPGRAPPPSMLCCGSCRRTSRSSHPVANSSSRVRRPC
jgi:hypothetical protein